MTVIIRSQVPGSGVRKGELKEPKEDVNNGRAGPSLGAVARVLFYTPALAVPGPRMTAQQGEPMPSCP